MSKERKALKAYRALLHLYPKAHRTEYGEQMLQTFDDLLSEDSSSQHAVAMWLRVGRELPANIIQEHIHNLEGVKMSDLKSKRRSIVIVASAVVVIAAVGLAFGLSQHHDDIFRGTTLARVQQPTRRPACLQTTTNSAAHVGDTDNERIGNAVASSINDVPAGTNVDVYFKTYDSTKATGTAVYSGSYGTYNFTAKNVDKNAGGFTGGWRLTHFEACKG